MGGGRTREVEPAEAEDFEGEGDLLDGEGKAKDNCSPSGGVSEGLRLVGSSLKSGKDMLAAAAGTEGILAPKTVSDSTLPRPSPFSASSLALISASEGESLREARRLKLLDRLLDRGLSFSLLEVLSGRELAEATPRSASIELRARGLVGGRGESVEEEVESVSQGAALIFLTLGPVDKVEISRKD